MRMKFWIGQLSQFYRSLWLSCWRPYSTCISSSEYYWVILCTFSFHRQPFRFFSWNLLETFLAYVKCFCRFALQISCPTPSLCFHFLSRCDCFVSSSHGFDEKKELDHERIICFPFINTLFNSNFIKTIKHFFSIGLQAQETNWDVGRTIEKLVNHSSNGSRFSSFSRVLPTFRAV